MDNEFSCTLVHREDSDDWLETFTALKNGRAETEMRLSYYGDKYWFLPVHYCKAFPIDVRIVDGGISVTWHTEGWELIQDERWFARLLRWLYIKVWLGFWSIYKRM